MSIAIHNEQEAAVAILFSAAMHPSKIISEQQIEHLSRAIVLCSRFRGHELNELTKKAISLQATNEPKDIIEFAAGFIEEEFRETLLAMVSEVVLLDGRIDDDRSNMFAMLALYLDISLERMKMILATYLIRNKWNVQIVDKMES
ncbi:MAG: hypothetical protein H0U44_04630 [Flavisolibacter sp.]|jgi:uncharacterized tellurite resistance protein B-like protein|nr:hypothetical protein [Flavisolibacter sp.]